MLLEPLRLSTICQECGTEKWKEAEHEGLAIPNSTDIIMKSLLTSFKRPVLQVTRNVIIITGTPHMYVFPAQDATRRVVKRMGAGLGFGWAFEYANGYLWKLGTGDLIRIDPTTGNYTTFSVDTSKILGPRGLCFDGEYFWVQDHSLLKIVKFKVNATDVTIYDSFDIPENETGRRQGLSTDGTYLYVPNRSGPKMFELYKNGTIHTEIPMPGLDLIGPVTWNGTHFWSAGANRLFAFNKDGIVVGQIYDAATEIAEITWDGTYLWGLYKLCETWDDAKMFQIEILDDSLIS